MREPLDALAGGDRPVAPRPVFVAELRERLLDALGADATPSDRTRGATP